eukprot:NODE_337_length_10662_cov_0.497207.p5 type:complete len:252 gc:universal NODE_337_length_10662_cov_0.497207:4691-5446(+)
MLLYHSFYFAFAYGIVSVMSLTSFCINLECIKLFGGSRLQYLLILLDILMIFTAVVVRTAPRNTILWLFLVFSTATYAFIFTVYFFFRCHSLLPFKMRYFGYFMYFVFYFVLLTFFAGTFGFMSTFIAAIVLVSAMPVLSIYTNSLFAVIIVMIKQNPLHGSSGKQTRLMSITNYTMLFGNLFAMSSGAVGIVGAFLENSTMFAISIALNSIVSFIFAISNVSMTANKYLDDKMSITNSTIFRQTEREVYV